MKDRAVALKYDKDGGKAPEVIAKGEGKLASTIIAKAEEFDVPIFANRAIVDSLINLEVDSEIPQELYSGVVEVFVWLMKNEKQIT